MGVETRGLGMYMGVCACLEVYVHASTHIYLYTHLDCVCVVLCICVVNVQEAEGVASHGILCGMFLLASSQCHEMGKHEIKVEVTKIRV